MLFTLQKPLWTLLLTPSVCSWFFSWYENKVWKDRSLNNSQWFDVSNPVGGGWNALLSWHLSCVCPREVHQGGLWREAELEQEVWQVWRVWWGQPRLQEGLRNVYQTHVSTPPPPPHPWFEFEQGPNSGCLGEVNVVIVSQKLVSDPPTMCVFVFYSNTVTFLQNELCLIATWSTFSFIDYDCIDWPEFLAIIMLRTD